MKVFILLSLFAVALARHECGENETFVYCGTPCPLTCENYDNPPRACILRCDIGCQCDKGYVRNADGRCVRPEECSVKVPKVCGVNQRYNECGVACPLTCDNYDNPPKICPAMCVIGCECEKGYVKTRYGECVRPEKCPNRQVCGENQRFNECGKACPLTCDNYNNPPKICPAMCVIGCECQEGYVKTKDGRCVRPEQCPSYVRPLEKSCIDKPDPGMCLAYFPSWYYDTEAKICREFIYGGCQGNGNRYATEEECMDNCASKALPNACQQEKVVGPCDAYFKRYWFNQDTGKCELFIYGGCGGNSNNFNSQEGCESVCVA